jgi:hypothetical protein
MRTRRKNGSFVVEWRRVFSERLWLIKVIISAADARRTYTSFSLRPFHDTKETQIHDRALPSILRQLHDDLDAAVFAAFG